MRTIPNPIQIASMYTMRYKGKLTYVYITKSGRRSFCSSPAHSLILKD